MLTSHKFDDKMDGKIQRDRKSGSSVRTLVGVGGKVEAVGIDSSEHLHRNKSNKVFSDTEYARDADGNASFSSYLCQAEEGGCGGSFKGGQNKEVEKLKEETFPIVNCRWIDKSIPELGNEYQRKMKSKVESNMGSCSHVIDGFGARPSISSACDSICAYKYGGGVQNQILLEKQCSFGRTVAVVGMHAKDVEISVFDAERYFSSIHTHEEKSKDLGISKMEKPKAESLRKGKSARPKDTGFLPDIMGNVEGVSSSDSKSIQMTISDSRTSWKSQSGFLSNAGTSTVNVLPFDQRLPEQKNSVPKCSMGCTCPCSNKKSVEIDDTLLDQAGRLVSVSSSLPLSHRSSPIRSFSSNYTELHPKTKMNGAPYSYEKNEGLSSNEYGNYSNGLHSTDAGSSGSVPLRVEKNQDLDTKSDIDKSLIVKKNDMRAPRGTDSMEEHEIPVFNPMAENSEKNMREGFSFSILNSSVSSGIFSFPPDKQRPSLDVFGSPNCSNNIDHHCKSLCLQHQSTGIQGRLRRFSAFPEKGNNCAPEITRRRSFSFPRLSFTSQESTGDREPVSKNTNTGDDDKKYAESDSSSDLFEIESFSTEAASYPIYSGRNCVGTHHTSSFPSLRQHTLKPPQPQIHAKHSGEGFCSVPSQASATSTKHSDKYTINLEKHCSVHLDFLKRSEENLNTSSLKGSPRGSSRPARRIGILLGSCRSDKAVSVIAPVSSYSSSSRGLSAFCLAVDEVGDRRGGVKVVTCTVDVLLTGKRGNP
eukprot:Gb_23351 [translate_table: standard]